MSHGPDDTAPIGPASRGRRRADLALRLAGAVVALLAGAGSALVEAVLTPLRVGGWPVPVAPVLAAVLGVPLVRYAVSVTGSTLYAVAPVVGWFAVISTVLFRTTEGDLILPQTPMAFGVLFVGAGSLVVGLYRISSR